MAKQLSTVKDTPPMMEADTLVAMLHHPLQEEINLVRTMVKGADQRISERIKWNAPSYYLDLPSIDSTKQRQVDFLTMHVKNTRLVHLIFHHPAIVLIESPLLEGNYKDRRMIYLDDKAAIQENHEAIVSIIRNLILTISGK